MLETICDILVDAYKRNWITSRDGTAVWYCKKMNMMPQPPVADSIRSAGVWDIDSMGLQKNPGERK